MNNTDGYENKKVIGLFDFDREGVECFYNIHKGNNWDRNVKGSILGGLFKKRNQHDCFYALLLPIPARHNGLISSVEDKNFNSFVEVENLLPDGYLTANDLVEEKQITGELTYKKIKESSKSKLGKMLVGERAELFEDFKPLFETIMELFGLQKD